MTIRRQWLLVLFLVAILSVAINTLVLGTLTNSSFKDYVQTSYDDQVSKILDYSKEKLIDHCEDSNNVSSTLEIKSYLVDPITNIMIYDKNDDLIINVSSRINTGNGNANGHGSNKMMNRMMGAQIQQSDTIDVVHDGKILGRVIIKSNSKAENSITSRIFMANLFSNSVKSVVIVLVIAFLIGAFVSKKMSKELVATANKAESIELGNKSKSIKSKVKEIQVIEHSLDRLKVKLDLKQISRKKLIDELIHQSRTPLTILKTHIEGYEDGVIDLNDDETKVLINQIDNVTSIISNLSGMIDAQKDYESIEVEEFDINDLINQITAGLRLQFEKKSINLELIYESTLVAKTDKYKLSQVIYNVLTNAYKYTPKGGNVFIEATSKASEFIIEIYDSGCGIDLEYANKIFDPYYRAPSNYDTSGDGIGLYIAKENMNEISGEISLDSNYKDGSKFIIKFSNI